ncbi:MAG: hypothetical protein ACSLFI_09545 [Solirubrobacterales bacterium]
MREPRRHLNRIFGGAFCLVALSGILAGCGGGVEAGSQFDGQPTGEFPVEVIEANFTPDQVIARQYDLELAVKNTGERTIPGMSVTLAIPGKGSTLAFAYRDRQVGLAQPQRPIWVLEEGWPKLAGTVGRGGAATTNRRTFNFGEVGPGDTADMIWRVTAVKPGAHRIAYQIAAGLSGNSPAVDASGETPEGVLPVVISDKPIPTKIDEQGNIVPLSQQEQEALEMQESDSQ